MQLLCRRKQLYTLLIAFVSLRPLGVTAQDLPWPHNSPLNMRHYPEHKVLAERGEDLSQSLQHEQPDVVRKMSPDPGEMFFLEYWSFAQDENYSLHNSSDTSNAHAFEPPMPLHAARDSHPSQVSKRYFRLPVPAAHLFVKRDFACPSNTNACTSINRPNVCCPASSTCQIVPDTGLGDVGCCDVAQTCAGSLSQCPSEYTGCPGNPGGGCCLPGYACFQEGCVQTSTTIVVVTPTPTSTSLPPPSPTTITDTTTVIITPPQPSTSNPTTITMTETVTDSPSTTLPPSSAQTGNTSVCSSGFRSCPASLGGLCCPTDRGCAPDSCPELTSTANPSPPVRGTSPSPSTTPGCPTGFYACSAYNPGGCCQVDRECRSTSCPARSDVTVVGSGPVTVVAPNGTPVSQSLLTGACATGWSTCDANVGGGCCPSGYACGTAACTASISGLGATQGKIAPNEGGIMFEKACGWWIGSVFLMIWGSSFG